MELIIEKNDGLLWGRIEGKGNFLPTTAAKKTQKLISNLLILIKDYQKHEGRNDKFWKKVDVEELEFYIRYDLQAFFEEFDFLRISSIALHAGINPGLLRQYASGVKYPSEMQAKKIEIVIHALANKLRSVSFHNINRAQAK